MSKPDLIIRNGTVVDGTGGPIRIADVVIRDGVVSDITESASTLATKEIDADGAWVTPGFIDPPHTPGCTTFLGPNRSTVCPTRRHHGGDRQLWLRNRAVWGRSGGIPAAVPRSRRGNPLRGNARRRALRVEQLRVLPRRTRQPRSRRQRCGVGPTLTTCAIRPWENVHPQRKRPTQTSS